MMLGIVQLGGGEGGAGGGIENLTKADMKIRGKRGVGVQVIKLRQHVLEFHF